jgi:transposase-like protein
MSQPLDRLDIRVVMMDGIFLGDHCILIARGVASDGAKHVLGLREGSTENSTVAKAMLSELIDRGLSTERPILFVIDGGKGLRKAITELFAPAAVVQRCQVHKRRNVLEHLPESMQPSVRRAMQQAYDTPDADLARRQLERLARSLEREHPGAAGSLREGLEETPHPSAPRYYRLAVPHAPQHQRHRESQRLGNALRAQRPSLERRLDDAALGGHRSSRSTATVSSTEGLP